MLTGQSTGAANSFAIANGLSGGAGVDFSATNAQDASNAAGTVNGVAFSTPGNTVEGVIPQSTLQLSKTAAPTNPIVVTITGDRGSIKALVDKVRLAYNEVVSFIDDQQLAAKEKNPASIGRDPLVRDLRSQLARVLNTERTVPGVFTAISQVGLGFTPDRSARVQRGGSSTRRWTATRPASRTCSAARAPRPAPSATCPPPSPPIPSAGGFLPAAQTRLNDQVSRIGERIDDMELRLAARREALQREFTAADLAIKQMNNSLGQLGSLGSVVELSPRRTMTPTMARGAEAYYQTHVQSRSPLELVVMLYDGALRFCEQAADAMDNGDMATKAMALSRAFAILAELQNTLNVRDGGDVARQLDALYLHMNDRLVDANIQRSSAPIRDVIRLLAPLRDAWSQVATPAA